MLFPETVAKFEECNGTDVTMHLPPYPTQLLPTPLSLLGRPEPLQLALLGFHHQESN